MTKSVVFFYNFCYNISIMEFEYDIIKFFQSNATPGWLTFFQCVTMLGSFLGFFITLIIIVIKNRKQTISLIVAFALGSLINHILKALIRRSRPFDSYVDIINYDSESGFSMPSGHSLCAGIFATYLIYTLFISTRDKWARVTGTVAISLFPCLVILSRMFLGAHYLTDTIAGLALGVIFAIITIVVNNIIIKKFNLYKKEE